MKKRHCRSSEETENTAALLQRGREIVDKRKPRITTYISIAVFSIVIISVLVMTISEIANVFDLFVTDKQRYEGRFGLDFDQASDIPDIPDWIATDDLPKYIDIGLTHFAYIRDDERPTQQTLDYVFGLVADEIGDAVDEQLLVELTDDLAETVVNALRAPNTEYAMSAWAYAVIPGLYDVLIGNTVSHTVSDGRGNSTLYRIVIYTHYKASGEITKNAVFEEDGATYMVSSMDNDYISRWNSKQNTYEGSLRESEYGEFQDDLFAGLVPAKKPGEVYSIEFVREYLAAKNGSEPMASNIAMSDAGEYAYVAYAAGPIENSRFPEVYQDPLVFGLRAHEIPGSNEYTKNPDDIIEIQTYYTRGHYIERSTNRECFNANMSIADIVTFAIDKPNADVNALPLLKALGESVTIIDGKETAGRCIEFARESDFTALESIDFAINENTSMLEDFYLQPLNKELIVSMVPVLFTSSGLYHPYTKVRSWMSHGPPWDTTREEIEAALNPVELFSIQDHIEERAVLFYESCKARSLGQK